MKIIISMLIGMVLGYTASILQLNSVMAPEMQKVQLIQFGISAFKFGCVSHKEYQEKFSCQDLTEAFRDELVQSIN